MANEINGLSRRALLVAVNISAWTGRKLDKKATATANETHHAESSAGSYHKKLLPQAAELAKVAAIASNARAYFHANTLPWMADGTRIISAKNYLNFASEIRKIKSEYESAVSEFSAAYPKLKQDAEKTLGDLYNPNEYPDFISDRFSFEVNYLPLPDVSDFRIEVSEAEKAEFSRKMREIESAAMRDAWSRLHSVIKNAAEKLSKPDAVFRDSLIDNISEMANILPMLNITEDSQLEKVSSDVKALVSKLIPETIRANPSERQDAASKLAALERNLSAYVGVKKP